MSQQGLSEIEVESRRKEFGWNRLIEKRATPAFIRFLRQFMSPVVLALVAATLVSAFLREWIDAGAIFIIILLNACVSFYQEAKAEKSVETLKKLSAPKAKVIRNGSIVLIESLEIVPDDIIVFEAGDFIAADARVIEARQLSTIEAALTGESLPVEKVENSIPEKAALAERTNMVFSGTAVASGSGRAIVVATGMQTEIGKIAQLLQESETELTPLQKNLDLMGRRLLFGSVLIISAIAIIGTLQDREPIEILMSAISLAVAAIPEGLPAVVTIALTLAVHRMVKRNAIVRHLPAVETLGSADVICTDKTGTLTTGEMNLREVMTLSSGIVSFGPAVKSADVCELLLSSVICSNATFEGGIQTGDPTEVALLRGASLAGISQKSVSISHSRIYEWSFDSNRKRMSVAVGNGDSVGIHTKGAPESVLARTHLSEVELRRIRDCVQELSEKGRRILAVGRRQISQTGITKLTAEDVEKDLEFLGLVSMADPPRSESIQAIKQCQQAGIKVVMITGDHPVTAHAIAMELGIIIPGQFERVLTGEDLINLNDEQLKTTVLSTAVYARVSPEDKLRIINAWKANGQVVAMTGDGVNDAPALKAASIGVAMGKGGTEVARQASSMVLADDNFATIVAAVEEGRAVFGNIRRTVEYLLSGNLAEIIVMLGAALFALPVPLAPIHLLWINLVTDGLPSLALAAEPVPKNILARERIHAHGAFGGRSFWGRTILIGSITGVMCLWVYWYSLNRWNEETARSLAFSFLVYAELFRSFASRSEHLTFFELGPRSNLLHLAAVMVPGVFQFFLHHSTSFQEIFNVRPLSLAECLGLFAITLIPATILEVGKLILRNKRKLHEV